MARVFRGAEGVGGHLLDGRKVGWGLGRIQRAIGVDAGKRFLDIVVSESHRVLRAPPKAIRAYIARTIVAPKRELAAVGNQPEKIVKTRNTPLLGDRKELGPVFQATVLARLHGNLYRQFAGVLN